MIDIGVNLLHKQFAADREEVIRRAHAAGVTTMLITATDLESTMNAIAFSETHDMFCTAGVHPHDAAGAVESFTSDLASLAQSDRVKAIGETGLDFNRNYSAPEIQRKVFASQLELACELHKPVFVHDRDSNGEVFQHLQSAGGDLCGVVMHCFTGSRADLERYIEAGYYIGITGWVCDRRRGEELRSLVCEIPLNKLLVETDAPFLLPQTAPADWHAQQTVRANSRRNEPALLPYVIAQIAELHQSDPTTVAEATARNARTLFDLPEPL